MKKFWIALIALSVAFMLAVPAMATNVTFSGTYRVRGHWVGDADLSDEDNAMTAPVAQPRRNNDKAWYDMRFRMSTVFEVSERLSVHTRFDALDKNWGFDDPGGNATDDNLDIDRIWMSIKSDWGLWEIGRMNTGVWGTSYLDFAQDDDRIKYTLPIGNFALIAIIEKEIENDVTMGYADADRDKYQLAGVYSAENWTTGLLWQYDRQRQNSEVALTNITGAPFNQNIPWSADLYTLTPYFTGQFGPFGLSFEFNYTWGEADFNDDAIASGQFIEDDFDVDVWALMLEGTYEMGPLTFQAGYAYYSGDDNMLDGDIEGFFPGTADWEKTLILNGGGPQEINTWGQVGNLAAANLTSLDDGVYGTLAPAATGGVPVQQVAAVSGFTTPGAHQFYLGADYAATEALSFSFLYMYAMAADEFSGWDDDYGHEVDLSLSYDIYENLTYSAAFAYLWAGDFWEGGNAAQDAAEGLAVVGGVPVNGVGSGNSENMWVMTHSLVLSF